MNPYLSAYRTPVGPEGTVAMRMVRSSRPARLLARILAFVLVAVAAILTFTPWVQTSVGHGRVVAYAPLERQQNIEAPIDGRIVKWHVREGSPVKAGDPVVDISDNDPEILSRLRDERAAVVARIEAAQKRAESIQSRISMLGASRESAISAAKSRAGMAVQRKKAAAQALEAARAAERVTKANIDRQRELLAKGLASQRAVELAELDYARAVTDVDRALATLSAAEGEVLALRADQLKADTDATASIDDGAASLAAARAEEANAKGELARLDVRLSRQAAQAVTAPRDGVILRLIATQATEQVKAGDPLAVIVPNTEERAVELWIDGNDVPLVAEGRPVRLQFEGWPAIQFSGWPSVAVGTFGGKVALVDAADDGYGRFRVVIVPDGQEPWPGSPYLRQGMRANGWIMLNEVRLGWELWRQFNGFPPSVPSSEAAMAGAVGKPEEKKK